MATDNIKTFPLFENFDTTDKVVIYSRKNNFKAVSITLGKLIEGITNPSNTFYIGDPNSDGSWRFSIDSDDLVLQQRESGSWVTKETFSGA